MIYTSCSRFQKSEVSEFPKKGNTKILLTSVCGPYMQDDEYGSRADNPMELYHNQITRVQGAFSLRMFHRSFALAFIQENISAPCWVLDFPSWDRFIDELKNNEYDVIGISSIAANLDKVRHMVSLIQKYQKNVRIVLGGHGANVEDAATYTGVHDVIRGDGISWFRCLVGEDPMAPIYHPAILSAFGSRTVGLPLSSSPRDTAAILVPSVGCPMGCSFCSTSAMFGGKGNFLPFFKDIEELYTHMCRISDTLKSHSFFILDENFLLNKKNAMKLLSFMEKDSKTWSLYVFSSANALKQYSIDELIRLGITWIWMGVEGEQSDYDKLDNVNTKEMVNSFQKNGIVVLGSSIIGLDFHTNDNIEKVIQHAVEHRTTFHQFMLYTALPGTPLYKEMKEKNKLLSREECPLPDIHGQKRFNHKHPTLTHENQWLIRAFMRDFNENGPSVLRWGRTLLNLYIKYKAHPDERVRKRVKQVTHKLCITYSGLAWACTKIFQQGTGAEAMAQECLDIFYKTYGMKAKVLAPIVGQFIISNISKENKKIESSELYEPECFYILNKKAKMFHEQKKKDLKLNCKLFKTLEA